MSINKIKQFLNKNWFLLSTFVILFVATIFRFYNFSNRWALAGDQAHFALAGKYMLHAKLLPLLGPFSSAGPFQTGGEWYWFVALGSMLGFLGVPAPWVFLNITYVVFVFLMIIIGKKLEGKLFGLAVGALAAVSTGEIAQGVNLSNQSPIPLFAAFSVLCMVLYLQKKKLRYIFLLSLSVGIAISIHLQGVALMVLILATITIGEFPGIKGLLLIPVGLAIPWIPVFIADSQNKFTNTHNMIYYAFFEKNKASFEVLGRRWLTFIGVFVPTAWANTTGGLLIMGYLMTVITFGFGVFETINKRIKRQWLILFTSTSLMFIVLRYTRTPLYDSFYVFLHPFIILLTGWGILQMFKRNNKIAVLIFVLLISTSLYTSFVEITKSKININPTQAEMQMKLIVKKLPQKKFAIYDHNFDTSSHSQSMALYLYYANKIDDNGMKIGYTHPSKINYPIVADLGDFVLYDISSLTSEKLKSERWVPVNPSAIYHSGQDWYKK